MFNEVNDTSVANHGQFVTTHWSVVLAAGGLDDTHGQAALARLCRVYWYPLYAYVRRQGHTPEDAQDLTQEFFARLLAKNYLSTVDRAKGRFRSFLLAALRHFLANQWDRAQAAKRGGGQRFISLDETNAETRYGLEPADTMTAERIFERRWALTLLELVLSRLRDENAQAGKLELYEQLKDCLTGASDAVSYAELGARLNLTEGAVKVAVHRQRRRYRELLREEIAQTVSCAAEVDDEFRCLLAALKR